ncbi:MAG: redoxin domain-containing protein, partial [Planctomycetaceae bacterium]|nr:redoxin domain-containing protein [Planctomycetaceae bacterium]
VPDESDVTLTLKQGKTIEGTVINLDGEPITGATLQLRHMMSVRHITQADLEEGRWPRMDDPKFLSLQNSEHAPLVTSDDQGTFRLTNLPENAGLMLDVLHDKHVPALAYAATVKELDAVSQQRLKRPVQAGKLDVQLDPGHDVTIKVVYEDTGEPAIGAHRYLVPKGKRNQQSFRNWVRRTDESQEGTFHLTAVKSGEFHFHVLGPDDGSFPPKYEQSVLTTELTPDQRKHEFTVKLPVSNLVPLTVKVVEEKSSEPVIGADIHYREVSVAPGNFTGFRTEKDGEHTVLVRPGKTYRFFVRDAGRGRMQALEFTPEAKTPGELTFKITPDPVYRGIAVNSDGQPVAGVSIFYRMRAGQFGSRSIQATTNDNGEFELKGLFAEIFFDHNRPITEPTSTLFYHGASHTGAVVELPVPNGEEPEPITVQLKNTEVVTGQLLEADSGMPVAGAKVQLTRLNQTPRAGFFQPIGEPVETNDSGIFRLQGGFVGEKHDLFVTKENFKVTSRADFEITEPGDFDLGMIELEPTKPRPPVWQVEVPDVSNINREAALLILMEAFEASESQFNEERVKDGFTQYRTPGDGLWQFSRHIWPLVEQDPTSEQSFAASLWLIKHWGFAGAYDKRHGEIRRQAAQLVYEHFIDRPELAAVATSIVQVGFANGTGRNMTPLEMGEILIAKNSHPAVRAAALYEVARWLLDTQGGSRTVMPEHKEAAAPLLQRVIDDFPNEKIYEGETYANRCREMLAEIEVQLPAVANATTAIEVQRPIEWTPKQLLDGMHASMAQYKTIDIRYEVREQRNTNAFGKGDEIIVEGNSSYLFRTDGNRWKADEKSFTYRIGTTELRPTAQTIGFDGKAHYALEKGELVLGQETSGDGRHHPATLFWRIGRLRSWLTKALDVPEARVVAFEEVDGHRCARVESQWAFADNGDVVKFNVLISPRQGFLPIQAAIDVGGKDGTHWQLSGITQDQDSGLWYPTGIHETHDLALPAKSKLYIVTHFSGKPNFTEDDFQLKHPGAVDIVDYRTGDVYFNDVWYPELKKFMREKFNQPPLWLEPTDHLISYADVAMNGKPAPELQAATWLPADPGGWKREGRKWTVLHFLGGGLYQPTPEQICGLKAFREKYKELGVDVIGVVPHDQLENAKRTIDTLQIDFPVAVSAPSDTKGYGQIYADFQLKTYGGTFLIDPEGLVHFINNQDAGGDSALTLEQALIKHMGLDKEAYKRKETGFVIEDWRAILREWRRLRNSTPAGLTLRGNIVSASKEEGDYGGVTIVAVPYLSVVHGHITAGHTVQDDNNDGVTVTCNDDGTFSIPGLRKATYKLKISGPCISSTERFANVQDGEVDEELEIRLE